MNRDKCCSVSAKQLSTGPFKPITLHSIPESPLLSVLIANYNYGDYIGEAIESVLSQTYGTFEVIVCDDGSTDKSLEIIKSYVSRDSRIRLIAKKNGGLASALNVAYSESCGDIICLLDSDDLFQQRKLERIVGVFCSKNLPGVVVHKMQIIDELGERSHILPMLTPFERGYIGNKLFERGGRWRFMPASAICFRREVAELVFPLDEIMLRTLADYYICLVSAVLTNLDFSKSVLAYYRLHSSNLTGIGGHDPILLRKNLEATERVYKAVNDRLNLLGYPCYDINLNINYKKKRTFLKLVESKYGFWDKVSELWDFTRLGLSDDLYTLVQKLGLFGYWLSLILPPSLRKNWLDVLVYPSKIKELIGRVLVCSKN